MPRYLNKSINFECLNHNTQIQIILLWTKFFNTLEFNYGLGPKEPFIRNNCPVVNCELTHNKSRLFESSYVIVHLNDKVSPIPKRRNKYQKWILMDYESPVHSGEIYEYNGVFNSTSTYLIDSEFSSFYEAEAKFYWAKNNFFDEKFDHTSGKIKLAAAVISNCGDNSKRLSYLSELQKYIDVDIYGKCGRPCPLQFDNKTNGNCKEIIASEYKFYLAFENSVCKDYITEKFFQILKFNIIPVVLGGGNYEHYVSTF